MKTTILEKPRAVSTVTVKLDPSDRDRIVALAAKKDRTAHYLMKEAIREYIQREEAQHNFIDAAKQSFEHYKETGLHISLDEFSAWVDEAEKNPNASMPVCHT